MSLDQQASPAHIHGREVLSRPEWRMVLLYVLGASIWIICSDVVLDWLLNDPLDSPTLQIYKGLKFVATTTVLLVLVLRLYTHRLRQAEHRLRETEESFGSKLKGLSTSISASHGPSPHLWSELSVPLGLLFLATIWIICSDMVLDRLHQDPLDTPRLQFFKGVNFAVTVAALLWLRLRTTFNRWRTAERQFRESEQRFVLAGRAASDVIWDWTIETNTVWWSDSFCRVFGYTREEVLPTTEAWLDRIHPEDKASRLRAIESVLKSDEQMWSGEYRFRRKDGTYAFVQDRACVIRDARGKPVRVVGGMTDITARKEAEEKLERSRRQLRSLSVRIQSLREEERTRIAREIHDELGQSLTALKMDLRWAEKRLTGEPDPQLNPILDKIVEAGELVDSTIASVQRIAAELRPGVLDDLGLTAALRHEARRFEERTGVHCRLQIPESIPQVSSQVAMAVFRIFQEALTNVARHAESTAVEVELVYGADGLFLHVADNGKGIQSSKLDDAKSLGLLGMKERARSVGGNLTFDSIEPCGTAVNLVLPVISLGTPVLQVDL